MAEYKYVGAYEVYYPNILISGEGSLVAKPGDVREFDAPPDEWWLPVEATPLPPAPAPKPQATPALPAPAKEVK